MNRRHAFIAAAVLAACIPTLVVAQRAAAPGPDAALAAAVAGSVRDAAQKARDPHRHPVESLTFWGLKPGMTVIEIQPGNAPAYWTEILAPYAKATKGRYIAAPANAAFTTRYGADEAKWGKVETATLGPEGLSVPAGTADLVITARNIHNWMWQAGALDRNLKAFHTALKPGGILAVEEHRVDNRPMANVGGRLASDGYVATAYVIEQVEKAGFKLEARSEANANPKDAKDHPFGVWTLPPTNRTEQRGVEKPADFNPDKYKTIGESDRMTLRFRKAG